MRARLFASLGVAATALTVAAVHAEAAPSARVLANTSYVEDALIVEVDGRATVYAATRGGVEAYSLPDGALVAHYTNLDGLAELHVRSLEHSDGHLVARLQNHRCTLDGQRFQCKKAVALATPAMTVAGRRGGARITKKLRSGGLVVTATAGAGLWLDDGEPRRLTATDQICSNHMMAMSAFRGRTYFGSFDEGLCSTADGQHFTLHQGPFRMINDLEVTPRGLYVAAAEGLFVTRDGRRFDKVDFVNQRGVNGLAFDGRSLWVTSPGALWRLRLRGGPRTKAWWMPGGSRSLQAVAANDKAVWIATEDRGLVRKRLRDFQVVDRAAGLPSSWALDVAVADDGTAYAATLRDGVATVGLDGTIARVAGVSEPWTLFVGVDGDELAVGSQGGAFVRGIDAQPLPLPNENVHAIHRLAGALYVGTEGGTLELR